MSDLNKVLQKLSTMETGINNRFDKMDARISHVETQMKGMETQMKGMDSRMRGMETQMKGTDARMKGMGSRMDNMEKNLNEFKTGLEDLKTGQANIQKHVAHNTEAIHSLRQDVQKLEGNFVHLASSVQYLSRKSGEHDTEIHVLKESINN